MNTKPNELSERKFRILSVLAILLIGWLCWHANASIQAQPAPANQSPQLQEIVKLTQAKMSDDLILSYIKNTGASYNLTADDILYLNSQGVSQPVISALLQSKPGATAAVAQPSSPAPQNPTAVPQAPAPAPQPQVQVSPYPEPASPYPTPDVAPVATAPPPGADINLAYFQAQLAPYGDWVDVPGHGPCFAPKVAMTNPDWRPYFNDGHWLYTDSGTFWRSDYPWGEIAFHYGRWMRDPHYRWLWVPGYQWGPAWVCWRHADVEGFCGWAPLPPDVGFEPGVGLLWHGHVAVDVDFGLDPDAFVFIPFDDFWVHDYVGFRAPLWRVGLLFRASILANHYSFLDGRFVFDGIGRHDLERLTHHEVLVERMEFHDAHIAHSLEMEHGHGGPFEHEHDHGHGFEGHP